MNKSCILINSCSIYQQLIEANLILLKKYWPDCKLPIYVNIDKNIKPNKLDEKYKFTYIISDLEPKGSNILDRLNNALHILKNKGYNYVLTYVEDCFLVRQMNNKNIENCLNFINENNKEVGSLIIYPSPPGKIINFYKDMSYEKYNLTNTNGIDYLCGHCIDKLYKGGSTYFPHRDANLRDNKLIQCDGPKENIIKWCKMNSIVSQVAIWDIEFLISILNKLINPTGQLKILKEKEYKTGNDWMLFEVFCSKYNEKFNLFKDKFILSPDHRSKVIYQSRSFYGNCVNRGWMVKWGRQLMEENNINLKYNHGYYVIDNEKIYKRKHCLTDEEHFANLKLIENTLQYTD